MMQRYVGVPAPDPSAIGRSVNASRFPAPKPPPILELSREADRLQPRFNYRNDLILFWRSLIRLLEQNASAIEGWRQSADPDDDERISITDPASIINGIIRRLGSLNTRFKVAADNSGYEAFVKADKSELFLRAAWHRFNLDHRAAGWGLSRQGALARFLAEDGHCYERLLVLPARAEMPFGKRFLDPIDCIPKWGIERGIEHLTRLYHTTTVEIGELRELLGKTVLPGRADDEETEITNYFDCYYTGVWADNDWVRKPALHHFRDGEGAPLIPVQATFHNGFPSATQSGGRMTADEREAFRGRSIIADHVGTILRAGDHLAAMQRLFYKAADPEYVIYPGDSPGVEVQRGPAGETILGDEKAKITPLQTNPLELRVIESLIANAQTSFQADGLRIDMQSARASGFDRVVASLEAQETYAQLVDAIESHDSAGAEMVLGLFKELSADDETALLVAEGFLEPDPAKPLSSVPLGEPQGGRQIRADFTAADVPDWLRVSVRLETLSTVNKAQLGSQLLTLVNGGLMSTYKALEYLDEPDPRAEMDRIRRDMALKTPQAMEKFAPIYVIEAAREMAQNYTDGKENVLAAMAELIMTVQGREMVTALLGSLQQPPGGGSGAPGQGPTGGMPGAGGMPGPASLPGPQPGLPGPAQGLPPGLGPPPPPGPVPEGPDSQFGLGGPARPSPFGTLPGQIPPEVPTMGGNRIQQVLDQMAGGRRP